MTRLRILVTGARGFVGSQILENLSDRFEIHAVSRKMVASDDKVSWHQANLLDPGASAALMADVRPAHLIHSAWETTHGAFWEAESNLNWLDASKALFSEFCAQGGTRIVACGTCAEYADSSTPLREGDDTDLPSSIYGRSKRELLRALQKMSVSHAWARIFYPYGAGEGPKRFVPSVCQSLIKGEVAKCSSGAQLRNFMDVRDLGAAIAKLTDHPLVGPVNLGHLRSHKLADVAKMLGEIAGRPDLIQLGALPDRAGEAPVLVPDLSRQTIELKFRPEMTLRDGLRAAYHGWEKNMPDRNFADQQPQQHT